MRPRSFEQNSSNSGEKNTIVDRDVVFGIPVELEYLAPESV